MYETVFLSAKPLGHKIGIKDSGHNTNKIFSYFNPNTLCFRVSL